jgi:hypothetical protein
MEEILYTPMQVRLKGEDAVHVTPVSLQTVIQDWGFEQQVALLQAKLIQLQAARLRLPADFATISDSYQLVISKYLNARRSAWFGVTAHARASRAVSELNALDQQREKIVGKVLTAKNP